MTDLTVVGGVYIERCIQPLWDAVFGSAGRAVEAVAALVPGKMTLVTYVTDGTEHAAELLAARNGATLVGHPSPEAVSFDYLHSLSVPVIRPAPGRIVIQPPLRVAGEVVLRYGMLEGDAVTDAATAIYDPQSAFGVQGFSANGSRAGRLAIVLNGYEAKAMSGVSDPVSAARSVMAAERAEVVVLKMGGHGALVLTSAGETAVPVYRTHRVWKIGSGDVFSATFAALWGCSGLHPTEAADLASRATASYCDTGVLPVPEPSGLAGLPYLPAIPGRGTVYLAAPFFDLAQRWLVEEARSLLLDAGARVFSPVHEVGPGPAALVAPADVQGIEGADVMLAVLDGLDPGTLFEVGYAVRKGIPVVALSQNNRVEDVKMPEGTGCEIVDDFVSAIYRTLWRLPPA